MFADVKGPSFIFWPVGCGDSTTIAISDTENLQIDLNDSAMAGASDNEKIPLVDELVAKLPQRNGKPYLSCFVLTHPDLDHCKGFRDLLKRVTIGELWHTPRIFREFHRDLCDDAIAFKKEAKRRVAETIKAGGDPGAGNRARIVGYDDLLQEDDYRDFPGTFFTTPGKSITLLDGVDVTDRFAAFVHAPFKDDSAEERNETSLAMQVLIGTSALSMAGLFFGDLAYLTLRRIFNETKSNNKLAMLNWNVLLAPHHCSKKAMYEKDDQGNDVLKQDILDDLKKRQFTGGCIVSSSSAIPGLNSSGDNPPHAKAKNRYQEIVSGSFLCTGECSTPEKMRPIIFTVTPQGIAQIDKDYPLSEEAKSDLAKAVAAARGTNAPPPTKVGFGRG
ncbi:MAG: ComEC/Rec2 family competence protein [Acidiferrobacter sp.]